MNALFLFMQNAVAQTEAAATQAVAAQPPGWMQFVPFAVILVVFYFFIIRPQAKKQKETQAFLTALKPGDQIITNSGILARVAELQDAIVVLEIANGVKIKVLRSQIMSSQDVLKASAEKA